MLPTPSGTAQGRPGGGTGPNTNKDVRYHIAVGDARVMDPEITKQFIEDIKKKCCTVWTDPEGGDALSITRVDNEFRCVRLSIIEDYREQYFFKKVDSIMLLYDPASRQTYERLSLYVKGIHKFMGRDCTSVNMVGVFDEGMEEEDRVVPAEEARSLAIDLKFGWFEVTPENNFNVHKAFKDSVRLSVWAKEGRDIISPMEALALCDEELLEKKKHRKEVTEQALNEALPPPVVKDGWLSKQGGERLFGRRNWKKRYFVLQTPFLYYYKSGNTSEKAAKVIDMRQVSEVTQWRERGDFHFSLVTTSRAYNISTPNEDEGKQWVGILRAVTESVGAVAAPPPRKFNSSSLQVPEMIKGDMKGRRAKPKYLQLLKHADMYRTIMAAQTFPDDMVAKVLCGNLEVELALSKTKVSLFVSSTFQDSKAEREMLRADVAPYIGEFCQRLGILFELVDPLLGLDWENGSHLRAHELCIQRMLECLEDSASTAVVTFMGDAYGESPVPHNIPAHLYSAIKAGLRKKAGERVTEAVKLFDKWYRKDENAIPSAYILRDFRHRRNAEKEFGVECRQMVKLIRVALEDYDQPLQPGEFLPTTSILEEEVRAGIIDNPDRGSQCLLVHRVLPVEKIKQDDRFRKAYTEKDKARAQKIRALAEEATQALPSNRVIRHKTNWLSNKGVTKATHAAYLAKVGDALCDSLTSDILSKFERPSEDDLIREILHHRSIVKAHIEMMGFARLDLTDCITNYVEDVADSSEHALPLILHGNSGSGKTWAFCHGINMCTEVLGQAVIVYRILGSSRDSMTMRSVLRSICLQIFRAYGQPTSKVPSGTKELKLCLHQALALASQDNPLVLFLDGVDAFSLTDPDAVQDLSWLLLEGNLPSYTRLVVTTNTEVWSSHGTFHIVQTMQNLSRDVGQYIKVGFLDADITPAALSTLFEEQHQRALTNEQLAGMISAFARNPEPLCLKIMLNLAHNWTSRSSFGQSVGAIKEACRHGLDGLIDLFLFHLEETHGVALVSRALSLLCTAKEGLSDQEMIDLISTDENASKMVDGVAMLPPLLWYRLRDDMEEFLVQRRTGHTTVTAFFHRQLQQAAAERYFTTDEMFESLHRDQAYYFSGLVATKDDTIQVAKRQPVRFASGMPNFRKLIELPFHLINAKMEAECAQILGDIDFVEAKCEAGMALEVLADIRTASELFDPAHFSDMFAFLFPPAEKITTHDNCNVIQLALLGLMKDNIRKEAHVIAGHLVPSKRKLLFAWRPPPINATAHMLKIATHDAPLTHCQYTPKGDLILSASHDATMKLTYTSNGLEKTMLSGHDDIVVKALVSKDGKRILSCSADGSVRIWNAINGEEMKRMDPPRSLGRTSVAEIGWSHDCQHVVFRHAFSNIVKVWRVVGDQTLHHLEGHEDVVTHCEFSPVDNTVATSSIDGYALLWDGESGQQRLALEAPSGGSVFFVNLSPSGEYAATAHEDKCVRLWNAGDGSPLATMSGHDRPVQVCLFSILDHRVVSWADDGYLVNWDLYGHENNFQSGENNIVDDVHIPLHVGLTGSVLHGQFSKDGALFGVSTDNVLTIFDPATMEKLGAIGGRWPAWGFSPDSAHLVATNNDGCLNIWDMDKVTPFLVEPVHSKAATAVSIVTDTLAASGAADGVLKLWNPRTGEVKDTRLPHVGCINAVAFSPNCKRVLTASSDTTLALWDVATGDLVASLEGHTDTVNAAAFRPDNCLIVSASADGTLAVWDANTGVQRRVLLGHQDAVTACVFNPSGQHVLSAAKDGTLKIHDAETADEVLTLAGHTEAINAVDLTKYGDLILSASDDCTLKIYHASNGDEKVVFRGHEAAVMDCVFSQDPGMMFVLSASLDKTLKIWDPETGDCLSTLYFPLFDSAFHSVAIHLGPSGLTIMAGDENGDVAFLEQLSQEGE